VRRSSRAAILGTVVAAFLALGAVSAVASVTVGADGASLLVLGEGPSELGIRFEEPASVTVNTLNPLVLHPSASAACVQTNQYKITCDDVFTDFQAEFDASNDTIAVDACFQTATIVMGDGTNTYDGPACTVPVVFAVGGGSGQDDLGGSFNSASKTVEQLYGNGGDDTLNGGHGDDVLYGGDGADTVAGDEGNDQMFGEGGADVVRGAGGDDREDGGPGDDRVGHSPGIYHDDDQGADDLRGGDGDDRLILEAHTGGMTIRIDGQANDGAPGEGDNVAGDFETIDGTGGNDVFFGSEGADQFSGGNGNDEIHGNGGADQLYGGSGDDRVYGDAGNDKVEGARGADTVDGGAGLDQIYGDIGACSFSCGFDADALFARDGERDSVDCGGGADTAQVDGLDVVAFCAAIDRSATPTPAGAIPGAGGAAGGAATVQGLVAPGAVKKRILLARGLAFRLSCGGACSIAAELRSKARKLGAARRSLLAAGTAKLVLKLSKAGRRTIRGLSRGKLTLRIRVTDAAGRTATRTVTVTLRR
jgi:Ca2+-binding RTX toxin-like protein